MTARVLLGDSSPSSLPANILDTLIEVCLYARDVTIAHEETTALWGQLDAAEASFADIAEQLQRFRRVGESGLLGAVKAATRDEMKEHGQQAAEALGRQIEGWLAQYESARDKQVGELRRKIEALHQQMLASLDRFALPLRGQPVARLVRRKYDDGASAYHDTAVLDVLPGLRTELQLEDTESEQPRRLKSLLGKGQSLQVGTKKALLRRTEEPAHVSLDDLVILAAQVSPEAVRLELGRKPSGPLTLRVGLGLSGETVVGRGELPDGSGNRLPPENRETVRKLWEVMQAEASRIIASPARSLSYTLRDEAVETPAGFVNVAERVLAEYRPTIRQIMEHSPNNEELTIKVEVGERREEKWIRREALAEHLLRVPAKFAERISVPEVVDPKSIVSAAPPKPAPQPRSKPEAKAPEPPPEDPDLEDKATRAYAAIPAELLPENTEDISLTDLEVSGEIVDDTPVAPPTPPKAPPAPAKAKIGLPSVKKPPPPGGARRPK
ncbi:MAG: hypothetical protein ACE37F_04180 [Nannocystaceae bacterium]|nr:hypothetical protein [bacterium]